ncbi:ABC-three component system protein [Psychrobacter jeotgali]|uniref:ABC-three component system protein n=1 Tax=Psychrobacter jeotgali TaxID=179010 RepID=UPI0019194447|nr:ABC-three component system protein [Psychrobacter jeotgali]
MDDERQYPHSAIATWSGFVYQGKVALYHCLKLIIEGYDDFELQLDSTEDFAIYRDGLLVSAHQVKAMVSEYRSSYKSALEKAAEIEGDRIEDSVRYLHVSVNLNDVNDYTADNGELVKIYRYGTKKYCGLGDIKGLSESLILEIFENNNVEAPLSTDESYLKTNYSAISEKISTNAIETHRKIQVDKIPKDEAAYCSRIHVKDIISSLFNNNPYENIKYFTSTLKADLSDYMEEKIANNLNGLSNEQMIRARYLFEHIYKLEDEYLKRLCQLINPCENFSKVRDSDIFHYSSLIQKFCIDPVFDGVPHYRDKENNFYLPTAISLIDEDGTTQCINQIIKQAKNNNHLLQLLYEYGNLIASHTPKSFVVNSKITNISDQDTANSVEQYDNIIKPLHVRIVKINDAEELINA